MIGQAWGNLAQDGAGGVDSARYMDVAQVAGARAYLAQG